MDGSFGSGRPFAFDAISTAQSAPGLSTALAQALFRADRKHAVAPPREPSLPRPANDRQRQAPASASRLCRLAWGGAGR
jgi:hypothetical protein